MGRPQAGLARPDGKNLYYTPLILNPYLSALITMTENNYYIFNKDKEEGPYTLEEVLDMYLDVDTMVLSPLANDWQRASDLPEFFEYFEARGIYFPTEDNLAGFGWRLLAYIADTFIMSYPVSFFKPATFTTVYNRAIEGHATVDDLILMLKYNFTSFLIIAAYHALCEFSPLQGSIGKKMFRLVVVDSEGRKLSFIRALLRNLGKFISATVFMVGYLAVLWDDHKQAWHDKWARTYVLIRNR
ncbi:RDD family protein [Mucilaginibacter terrigena]|uniref:RDD family protein n=1 Tax=Mucilaginibacter terrigena TaxID=2492395 RepID=A0A4Q5LH88_9SPHI|nr:RDD family protein [Mucilaginibacter terrigena]RYU86840.1 RDD family protein [Mucilaginibacter terrigena]